MSNTTIVTTAEGTAYPSAPLCTTPALLGFVLLCVMFCLWPLYCLYYDCNGIRVALCNVLSLAIVLSVLRL